MGNALQKLPLGQPTTAQQVYAALYGNQPIDPNAAAAQPVLTPDLTYSRLSGGAPPPAPPEGATPANAPAQGATTAENLYNQKPKPGTAAAQAGTISGAFQPAPSGSGPGTVAAAFEQGKAAAPTIPAGPGTPSAALAAPPALQMSAGTAGENLFGSPPQGAQALPAEPNAPIPGPPNAPIPLSRGQKIMRDIAIAMNPIGAPMAIEGVLNTQRGYQQRLQEYQRNQPAMQAAANREADLLAAQTAEASARGQEAAAGAAGQTVRTQLEQTQFEQGQRLHVAEQIQGLASAYMQGNLPPASVMAIGQRIYQNDPIVQGRMTPEQWSQQLQAIAHGQPTQASMQVAKVGDVPASISWMGQSWNAHNIGTAPLQVQLRWEAEVGAHNQQITEEKAREAREFGNHMAIQLQSNKLELDRMSTMFGFKNAQEAQGRYYKAQQDINDADAQFSEVQKLAQNPNSANDHLLLMKAAGGSLPEGTKRLNVQEIENIKQLGGLDQRAEAELRNWGPGTVFTPETRAQLVGALKTVHDSNVARANADVAAAHQLFQQSLVGVPTAAANPQAAGTAQAGALPPAAIVQLKEGLHTTFANGQTWTLQAGKPVQVQ